MAECLGDARKSAGCEACYVRPGGVRAGMRQCHIKIVKQARLSRSRKPLGYQSKRSRKWRENNRERNRELQQRWWYKPYGGYYQQRKRQLAKQRSRVLEQLGGLDDS